MAVKTTSLFTRILFNKYEKKDYKVFREFILHFTDLLFDNLLMNESITSAPNPTFGSFFMISRMRKSMLSYRVNQYEDKRIHQVSHTFKHLLEAEKAYRKNTK